MTTKTFDPKCFQLAEQFLADDPSMNTEAAKATLARAIQDAIEIELSIMREDDLGEDA